MRSLPRSAALLFAAAALVTALPGCFAGSLGVALGIISADDDGKQEAADAPRAINLEVREEAPGSPRAADLTRVQVAFDLVNPTDAGLRTTVEFAGREAAGVIAEGEFAASRAGVPHTLLWDAAAAGLTGYQTVRITVTPRRGNKDGIAAATEAAIGNDPPTIPSVSVAGPDGGTVKGDATITFELADSAGDPAAIALFVSREGGEFAPLPDDHLIAGLAERFAPGTHKLTWASARTLGGADLQTVVIGIAPDDRLAAGAGSRRDSAPFRADNDLPPTATIEGAFALHPDQRRGLPVPFHLEDPEGGDLLLVCQWRYADEPDFPDPCLEQPPCLPPDRRAMEALLADPAERRRFRIATELPPAFEGRLGPAGAGGDRLRLPELVSGASPLLAGGLAGRELEVLRDPGAMAVASGAGGLNSPVAVLPIADGLTALALDRGPGGTWRLQEIDLATGRLVRALVPGGAVEAGPGNPTAMALSPDGESVLAAIESHGVWWLVRAGAATGHWDLIARRTPAGPPGPVRGLAALGAGGAAFTAGDALLHLDGGGRVTTVLTGLEAPWGLAADPLRPGRLYVAERDRAGGAEVGRVSLVDLATLAVTPVAARLPRPEAIALERGGSRLLAVTDDGGDGRREVAALDLGPAGEASLIASGLTGGAGALATGPDGLRVLALPALGSYALAGGIESRRMIAGHQTARGEVLLDAPLDPRPRPGSRWRILDGVRRRGLPGAPPAPVSRDDVFIWDARDAPRAGDVVLRLTAYDAERGTASEVQVPKRIVAPLEVEPALLGGAGSPNFVQAGDLNRDGLPDVAAAGGAAAPEVNVIAVYFQRAEGSFGREGPAGEPGDCPPTEPDLLLGSAGLTGLPGLALADLDGDGHQDLASANRDGNTVTIFLQKEAGVFGEAGPGGVGPDFILGGPEATAGPEFVLALDADADGDLDLVSANEAGGSLAVFRQSSAGEEPWRSEPDLLLGRAGPAAPGPIAIAAGDVDGDGGADLIAANPDANDLTVYLRKERGEFGKRGPGGAREPDLFLGGSETTQVPRSLALADLDGDGDLDLAAAAQGGGNFEGSGLALLFQDAPGDFRPPVLIADADGIGSPRAVAAGDLDGDGDLDLGCGNVSGNRLAVLFQHHPGSFGDGGEGGAADLVLGGEGVTGAPRSLVLADLDLDGDLDLLSANPGSFNLAVFLQRSPWAAGAAACGGRPEEEARETFGNRVSTLGPVALAAADLDLDGGLDLVAANLEGMSLAVFFQDDRGSFGEGALVRGSSRPLAPRSVATADLDGDGDLDLLAANGAEDELGLFLARGRIAEGVDEMAIGGPGVTRSPRAAVAADLDGDGDLDLAAANHGGNDLTVFLQHAPLRFGVEAGSGAGAPDATLGGEAWTRHPVAIAAADLDGDGDLDLAAANHGLPDLPARRFEGSSLALFLQREPGVFGMAAGGAAIAPDAILGGPETTRAPGALAAADLDGDGRLDLIAANLGGDLTAFLQDGGGLASPPVVVPVTGPGTLGPVSVAAADLDRDGYQDLVSANDFGSNLTVFRRRGPAGFGTAIELGGLEVTTGPACVLALDLDGDGDQDLVSANARGDDLTLFPGGR